MEAVAALERDAQLMLRVREGDEISFGLLLERHRAPVVNFLHRMVQNRAISEELAQEVFLRVYRSRETYEPTAKFTTWLFRIATHLALNWIRDGKKEKSNESLSEEVMEGVERQVADRQPSVGPLDRDDKLGAMREQGAGHDPDGAALGERVCPGVAGRYLPDDRQSHRVLLGRGRDVFGVYRVPVHRRVVE